MESRSTRFANLLQLCIDKKAHRTGKHIHAYILRNGLISNTFLSNRLIEFYSKCSNTAYAHQTFDEMPSKDVFSWNAILGAHCKAGDLDGARQVFAKMPERNTVSWNNVISALVRNGFEREALDVYDGMASEGHETTRFTLASVFSACGAVQELSRGRRFHGLARKIGLESNVYVSNALLSMYSKCGVINDAVQALQDMAEPNEVAFTALMSGLAQTNRAAEAFRLFRLMLRKGIHVDSVSLSSIMGVCAKEEENDGICIGGKQVHSLMIKLGFDGDLHLNNSLLDMYAKHGDMDSAEEVFSGLPKVNVVTWNIMISGYGQRSRFGEALRCLERMSCSGFEPDDVTYINMLASCVKCGDIETARRMFDEMSNPSVGSWNAMLSGYSQSGNHGEAVKLFRLMQFRRERPDRTTLAIALSSCATTGLLEPGKQIHGVSIRADFHEDVYVASGLIGVYSKCGDMGSAEKIFHRTPETDNVCWNSMIAGFSFNSRDQDALSFFARMRQHAMYPSPFSYATVLSSCAKLSSSSQGRQIHGLITKDGFLHDVFVGSALIGMYCKCGHVDEARRFFDSMATKKNIVTWNEMIHGYAQNGHGDEAVSLYRKLTEEESGESPDSITFVAVLTACSHSGLTDTGLEIFESMKRVHGIEPGSDHYTCVVDSLGRAGRFEEAAALVDGMACKDDPVLWEVLLSCCRLHGNVGLAKRAADELFRLSPGDSTPYVLLGNIYSSLGRWDEARDVRDSMSDKRITKGRGYSRIEHKMEGESC